MESRIRRRRLVPLILAIALAAETVGVVAASMPGEQPAGAVVDQAPAGRVLAAAASPEPRTAPVAVALPQPAETTTPAATIEPSVTPAPEPTAKPKKTPKPKAEPTAKPKPSATPRPAPKATPKPKPKPKPSGPRKVSASDFRGTNHVWIPALGINKSVQAFPCDRNRPPDNYMYRWGCAGENNIYLMGHAYAPMKPLHDAYYNGRLRVGLKVYYAGSNGKVHVYAVRWWKKTLPTPDASWAWAPQPVPSMTLQTCVGTNSKYRLMVRLVEVDG